jgi:ATP-dependent DNA helicase PIF1
MSEISPEPATRNVYAAPSEWLRKGVGDGIGNIFLTGRAGTGKTTLLRKFLDRVGDKAVVLAPTGVAAVNVGGQTIHSFFKLPPRMLDPGDIKRLPNGRVIRAMETLIIDEVSMVRADMLDAIDRSLKLNRKNRRPFGGVRVILSGDLHQLPPVVRGEEVQILQERFGGAYFHKAPAFADGAFSLLALKHVFRQDDPDYLNMLGAMRNGRVGEAEIATIQSRVSRRTALEASETHVVLTPNNASAWRINQARLEALDTAKRTFEAEIKGEFDDRSHPTEQELELKLGARVMVLKNDPEGRWVNGSIGLVEGFEEDSVLVKIGRDVQRIEPALWEKYKYTVDKETEKVSREVVGAFKQVPLRLAYAVTVHKAQGLTLEKVYIDFDSGMFTHGQAYVAFSRARSLEGLELSRPLRPRDLVIDRGAFDFGSLDVIEDTKDYMLARFERPDGELV